MPVPVLRLLLISTFVASLTVGTILTVGATITAARSSASDGQSQNLGSVEDYLKDDDSFTRTYQVPFIGIQVGNGRSELKSGARLAGIEIYTLCDTYQATTASAAVITAPRIKVVIDGKIIFGSSLLRSLLPWGVPM